MPNYALTPNDSEQDELYRPCKAHSANLEQLRKAMIAGNVALLEVTVKATGERVAAICALNQQGTDREFVPFAVMLNGDPYELLLPPDMDHIGKEDGSDA